MSSPLSFRPGSLPPSPVDGRRPAGAGTEAASEPGHPPLSDDEAKRLKTGQKQCMSALNGSGYDACEKWRAALGRMWKVNPAHPDVQQQTAECIEAAALRWSTGQAAMDLLAELCTIDGTLTKPFLWHADATKLNGLRQLLTQQLLQPAVTVDARQQALHAALVLRAVLPPQMQGELDRDIVASITAACWHPSPPINQGLANLCWLAIGRVPAARSDAHLNIDLGAALLRAEPYSGLGMHLDTCWSNVAQTTPRMPPARRMEAYRRLDALLGELWPSHAEPAVPPPEDFGRLMIAMATLLDGTDERSVFAPRLASRLLDCADATFDEDLQLDCFKAAIQLGDNADSQVGVRFHEILSAKAPDEAPGNADHLAVMSFHLDPGNESFFEAQMHEPSHPTVRIDYPKWLVDVRARIAAILNAQPALLGPLLQPRLLSALQSSIPSLTTPGASVQMQGRVGMQMASLIDRLAGPSVDRAQWTNLEGSLQQHSAANP